MGVEDRWKWTRSNRYCFSCLNYGHSVSECRGQRPCGQSGCNKPHHRLLHVEPRIEVSLPDPPIGFTETLGHTVVSGHVNLNILPVTLKGPRGSIQTFAMLDPGATLTALDAGIADKLGLTGPTRQLTHSGLHEATTVSDSRTVNLTITGQSNETFPLKNVRTMPHISLPKQSVKRSTLQKWNHLKKIPVTLYDEGQPTILIGNDHAQLCNTSELVLGPANAPAAGKTKLGWVLMGRVGAAHDQRVSYHIREETEDDLHQLVKYHFSAEAFGVKPDVERPRSKDDARAMTIMNATLKRVGAGPRTSDGTSRRSTRTTDGTRTSTTDGTHTSTTDGKRTSTTDGTRTSTTDGTRTSTMDSTCTPTTRWECGLLWRADDPVLPSSSKQTALTRLYSMERKMDASPEFAEAYQEKIAYYLKNGYAQKLTEAETAANSPKTYYLPHFMAKNPKKQNKLRFVFDAASKTSGKSLNDFLLPGPDQLKPLATVLFMFRERRIAITSDVKDMFHRVGVTVEDADAQRFLWRGMERNREPDVYRMDVLIFGATCSPAIAQEAKNRNAREFLDQYPEIVKAVVDNFFVDDYADSCDTVVDALQKMKRMQLVMEAGDFHLCKWDSNSEEFREKIPEELRAERSKHLEITDGSSMERILGLFWKPQEDNFTFSLKYLKTTDELLEGKRVPTKKELLSLAMSIYDPLGLLGLFTVRAKMLLQDTWRTKIGWDDEIPEASHEKWDRWRSGLQEIQKFEVTRCYSPNFSTSNEVVLHVFVDASEQGFGAVAYFVTQGAKGREVTLVGSKARVAHLKPISIPRMELQAAVLGARFAMLVREGHTVAITRTVFWSDSRTVLAWLVGDGRKFQQFVAHRVGEIQELTNPQDWRWVPTKLNVADKMTRDNVDCDFSPESRWVRGPEFLQEDESQWPEVPKIKEQAASQLEMKKEFLATAVESKSSAPFPVENYSSWSRLIRVTCWIRKFFERVKKTPTSNSNILTPEDLVAAERVWYRTVQMDSYPEELKNVKMGQAIPRGSKTGHLSLFLDEHGILRLYGRLKNADLEDGVKCPLLLDPKHPYTRLLLSHYHQQGGHHGQERLVNEIRQKYYLPNLRAAVRSTWTHCQKCRNDRATPRPPLMGQLPLHRLEIGAHPFTNTGVDYFGPMEVTVGRRHEKRWGALFTCLSTRAVHLEIAGSLSTDSCIMAIRRFVGRRGCPKRLYSDNGTNFHGANNELKKTLAELNQATLNNFCGSKCIEWHFNPPSAPHMGGSWERLVRSVKVALFATLREQAPREEVLQTLLVEAEHSVNSHPLTYVPVDPEDPEALTPNHFLIGRSSNVAPAGIFEKGDLCSRKTWRKAQYLADSFWKRWMKEYLPTLQRRTKWMTPTKPRNKWNLGRVTAVYPGDDGITRVVDLKTLCGTYRRPVVKLAFLDVKKESEAAPMMTKDASIASLVSGSMSPPVWKI